MATIQVPEDQATITAALTALVGAGPHTIDVAAGTYAEGDFHLVAGLAGKTPITIAGRTGVAADVEIAPPSAVDIGFFDSVNAVTWNDLTWTITGNIIGLQIRRCQQWSWNRCRIVGDTTNTGIALIIVEGFGVTGCNTNIFSDCYLELPGAAGAGYGTTVLHIENNAIGNGFVRCAVNGGRRAINTQRAGGYSPSACLANNSTLYGQETALQFNGTWNNQVRNSTIIRGNKGVLLADDAAPGPNETEDCRGTDVRGTVIDVTGIAIDVRAKTVTRFGVVPWTLSNYNTLRNAGGVLVRWGATTYTTLAAWQADPAGQDAASDSLVALLHAPNGDPPDVHPQSRFGRWDPGAGDWAIDVQTSPCVDGGDPADPVGSELAGSNGGVINRGAHGGTAQASLSSYPTIDTPCEEVVTFGSHRFGTFLFGDTEHFLACDKIVERVPPYVEQPALFRALVGGIAKQIEIHRRELDAFPLLRRHVGMIDAYGAEWGLLLRGNESASEIIALLGKRDTIIGARGTVAHPTDPDAGILGELDRITAAPGENIVEELDLYNTGWWLTSLKVSDRLSFPGINRYGQFSRRNNYVWLNVSGLLIVVARNRNPGNWTQAAIEAAIRHRLIPADANAIVTVVNVVV